MANTFAPFGLLQFGHRSGSAPMAATTRCFIASSDVQPIFYGDTVKASTVVASSNTNYVSADTNGQALVRGVFMGCEFFNSNVGRVVWSRFYPGAVGTGAPDVVAYVVDDPEELFICQASTNAQIGSSNVGSNIGVVTSSSGSTLSGQSNLSLSSSSVLGTAAGSSLPFRIVDVYANYAPPGSVNVDVTTASAIFVVAPNNWERKNTTARATQ